LTITTLALAIALAAPASAASDAQITFRFAEYTPRDVTVARGQSVTWTADPGNDFLAVPGPSHHPLKFVGNAQPAQTSGTTTTRTFSRVGKFPFYCAIHWSIGMVGSVTVTER
jgi:plastocyanin